MRRCQHLSGCMVGCLWQKLYTCITFSWICDLKSYVFGKMQKKMLHGLKTAVTHLISVWVKRAPGVLKNCKIPHTPNTRRRHVRNSLRVRCVRLVYVRRASLYVAKNHRAFIKIFLNMLKNFLEARRVLGVWLIEYVLNKFHARYRRVEYASNAFGARLRHASVPILWDIASVACHKGVWSARWTFAARP